MKGEKSIRKNEVGKRYGQLLVLQFSHRKGSLAYWKCLCDCGKIDSFSGNELRFGRRTSCGHLRSKHGFCRNYKVAGEYYVWRAIKRRIYNQNCPNFKDYGGRDLDMDPRWRTSFAAFMADVGPKPGAGYSIERINNNLGYWPGNCRWATAKEQQNNQRGNRRFTWNGMTKTVAQWCEYTGLLYSTLYTRLCIHNWTVDDAITKPFGYRRPKRPKMTFADYSI